MKKTLTALASLMMASAAAGATMDFGYSGTGRYAYPVSDLTNVSVNAGDYMFLAFEVTPDDVSALAGTTITGLNVTTGSGAGYGKNVEDTDITLFITEDLTGAPAVKQDATLKERAFSNNSFTLTEPYTIKAGQKLYVGYSVKVSGVEQHDFMSDLQNSAGRVSLVGVSADGSVPQNWTNVAETNGAFCMSMTVTGDNLPTNLVSITALSVPEYAAVGHSSVVRVNVFNHGTRGVGNIDFTVKADNETEYTRTLTFPSQCNAKSNKAVNFELDPFTTEGMKNVTLLVGKVNGTEQPAEVGMSNDISCLAKGFGCMPVIEEGTGTWCGGCPRGIVMFEHIAEVYGDKVALVSVHTGKDPLVVNGYSGWVKDFAPEVPTAVFNRKVYNNIPQITCFDNDIDMVLGNVTFVNPELGEATFEADGVNASIPASVEFSMNTERRVNVSLIITEDGLGPYNQTNYYAGNGTGGEMAEWESKPNPVSTVYDDVARDITAYPGTELNSGAVTDGDKLSYTFNLSSMDNIKAEEFLAIMLVTDAETGEVINACSRTYKHDNTLKVSDILTDSNADVTVYTLDGVRVSEGNVKNLPAGIYIVRKGSNVRKVIVK